VLLTNQNDISIPPDGRRIRNVGRGNHPILSGRRNECLLGSFGKLCEIRLISDHRERERERKILALWLWPCGGEVGAREQENT
jgi:hypothetical protein